jgi:hypothetical protein
MAWARTFCKMNPLNPLRFNLSPEKLRQFLNDKIYSYTKEAIWHLAILQNWCFGQFYHSKIEK